MAWELSVVDASGFTFTFTYDVNTYTQAVKEFKRRCRRGGGGKLKHTKILESRKIERS